MSPDIWENIISLNAHTGRIGEPVGPVSGWLDQDDGSITWDRERLSLETAVARDNYPLPDTRDREGYYGPNHFNYWASGLRDFQHLTDCAAEHHKIVNSYLDFGCASGRVVRHFSAQSPDTRTYGADINREHIDWIYRHLPRNIIAFHNHSVPSLPLADNSISLVSAFSVFTHIESFDVAWLMEVERVMEPDGIAWLTVHTEGTWSELDASWPLHRALRNHPDYKAFVGKNDTPESRPPLSGERMVFRWHADKSYSANVFLSSDYINQVWGRIFEIVEIRRRFPAFQDVVICRKRM